MVKVGDKIPSATLKSLSDSGIQDITTEELTTGKKVRARNEGGGNSKLQPVCGVDRHFATSSQETYSHNRI
jgi:peroxiredoxin